MGVISRRVNLPASYYGRMQKRPRIIDTIPLPDDICGYTDGSSIWLNPKLSEVGRRCTLEHELVHCERGLPPEYLAGKEERKVDQIAAHRLAMTEQLVEAILWTHNTGNRSVLAWYLNLDQTMLDVRLTTATPEERALIEQALEDLVEIP